MTGAGTLELRADIPAELAGVFRDYGHDLVIVRPTAAPTWGSVAEGDTRQAVRGLLMPASDYLKRQAVGSSLPVPAFEAYLPYDPALSTPGWHLEHAGLAYYPTGDAKDEGGQGLVWVVSLSAPGQVMGSG